MCGTCYILLGTELANGYLLVFGPCPNLLKETKISNGTHLDLGFARVLLVQLALFSYECIALVSSDELCPPLQQGEL